MRSVNLSDSANQQQGPEEHRLTAMVPPCARWLSNSSLYTFAAYACGGMTALRTYRNSTLSVEHKAATCSKFCGSQVCHLVTDDLHMRL